jgi:hypothetical protein
MNLKKALVQAIIDRMKDVVGVSKDVDLAESIGASRSQPAVWKIRDRIPFAECMAIAEKHGVSLDWLILGRGVPGIEEPENFLHPAPVVTPDSAYVEFPAFDMPSFIDGETAEWSMRLPSDWVPLEGCSVADTIAMRIPGNCMAPTINDGEVVLVDRRPRDIDGVYVLRVGESIRVRRVQRMYGGALHLLCDNADYETDVIGVDQADAVDFIGYCFARLTHAC